MTDKKLKKGDRVKRKNRIGTQGTIQEVREEIIGTTSNKQAGYMIKVAWDNGTISYFDPEGIEAC